MSGEFNLEVQHTSKIKDIQSFPLFLRRPESGKLLGITSMPPVERRIGVAWLLLIHAFIVRIIEGKKLDINHNWQ